MTTKHSISRSLDRAFLLIILFSVLSSGIALITLTSNLYDAEVINIASSLRMQSYRLGYEMEHNDMHLTDHRSNWQQTLNSLVLLKFTRYWYISGEVKSSYHQLRNTCFEIEKCLENGNKTWYQNNIQKCVTSIDDFMLALQHYTKHKMQLVVWILSVGILGMLLLVIVILRWIRGQVVVPLNNLVSAIFQMKQGSFFIQVDSIGLPNEFWLLLCTFNHMLAELQKYYHSFEIIVEEKIRHLNIAYQQLEVLFKCSQALNTSQIDTHCFRHILQIIRDYTGIDYLELESNDNWQLSLGVQSADRKTLTLPLVIQNTSFGKLHWQQNKEPISELLMQNIATMLGRGLSFNRAQKQFQQLLLMEERSVIARELHDSLAQALSYLQIQLALLKHTVPKDNYSVHIIISDFSRELNNAWRQLRELLSTFRLTLNYPLPVALQEAINSLQSQTSAKLMLDFRLSQLRLDAQKQVHLFQIIREAVLNAIKHAQATEITVSGITTSDGEHRVYICDNGVGISSTSDELSGHYGLNIMRERVACLGGILNFKQLQNGGTQVCIYFRTHELDSNR